MALFGILMAPPEQLSNFALNLGVAHSKHASRHQAALILSRVLLIAWCTLVAIYLYIRRRAISAAFVASRKLWAARRWERELLSFEAERDARGLSVEAVLRDGELRLLGEGHQARGLSFDLRH